MVFNGDFGTHAADFSGEHEAVFENILGNHGVAVRDRGEQHELRLQIGGETRMRQRLNIGGQKRTLARNRDGIVAHIDRAAHGGKLHKRHAQEARIDAANGNGTARKRAAHEESARFNAVANRGMLARMQAGKLHAIDDDFSRAGARNASTHRIEHVRKVFDFRLASRVLDNRLALSRHGAHHGIFRGAHAGEIESDVRTVQAVGRACFDIAVVGMEMNAKRLHANHMHVDFASAQVATARHGNASLAETSHQGAENRNGCAHLRNELIRRFPCINASSVNMQRVTIAASAAAKSLDNLRHNHNVGNKRHVMNGAFALA